MNEIKYSLRARRWREIAGNKGKLEGRWAKRESKGPWKDIATTAAGITSLAGLALYGSVHFADAAFYAHLGLTPEDVGLNPAVTLGRVSVSFMLIAAALFIVVLPVVIFWRRTSFPWLFLTLVGSAIGNVLLIELFAPSSEVGQLAVGIGEIVFVFIVLAVHEVGFSAILDNVKENKVEVAIFASFVVLLVFGAAGIFGLKAAYGIDSRVTPESAFGVLPESFPGVGRLGLLGVEAKPANIVWVSDSLKGGVATTKGFPLVFLGTERNLHFLYDARRRLVIRVPATLVLIDTRS
ncbi:hypothetical protein SAFG77S_01509 [Streptomyces afghaniensis]|uniref:hypothetical protein n=1 Tax=Streptomyces TaxID=1883 RepID=UPI000FE1BCB3|nr:MULTISPECIES: hypothetical protein [Streptomyces]UOB11799.1 hypothetical protein MQE23_23185 [Streptomyces sp. HP-A2021]